MHGGGGGRGEAAGVDCGVGKSAPAAVELPVVWGGGGGVRFAETT